MGITRATNSGGSVSVGAARNGLTGWYHVNGYGASMTAGTGGRAAVQAAVDAAVADIVTTGTGRTVYIPEGVVLFDVRYPTAPSTHPGANLGVALPVNLPATLRIKGAGSGLSTIRLTTNARNAFWINKQADYDVFQNVTFEDFDVDNNNAPGRCHILVGNFPEYQTAQTRLSFENIAVRRMRCYGVPYDATEAVTVKYFLVFDGRHPTVNEATQTHSTNIVCEDLDIVDAQYGLAVYTPVGGGSTNHYYDQIHYRRCRHRLTTIPPTFLAQTSFYVCGAGFGDHFTIVDCESVNSGDDAVEVGSMQTGIISGLRSTNAWLVHILFRLTRPLANAAAQRIVIRDSTLAITPALYAVTSGVANGAPAQPVQWINDDPTNSNFGTFIFDNVHHVVDGARFSRHPRSQGLSSNSFGFRLRGTIHRVVMNDCTVHYRNFVYDTTGIQDCDFFYPSLSPVQAGDGTTRSTGYVELRNCAVFMEGTTGTSADAGGMNLIGISAGGAKGRVMVDGFTFQTLGHAPTNAISTGNLALIGGHGTPQLVRLRALSGFSYTTASGAYTRRGVLVRSTTLFDKAVVQDCDFRFWVNNTSANNVETTSGGANTANVTALNNLDGP